MLRHTEPARPDSSSDRRDTRDTPSGDRIAAPRLTARSAVVHMTQTPLAGDNEGTGPAGPQERDINDRRARQRPY